MENNTTKSRGQPEGSVPHPSIIGVILFMIPVKNADGDWTVVVKIIADIISGAIGGFLPSVRHHPDGLRRHVPCCVGKAQVHHG